MKNIAIIGGGAAGLAAAHHLAKHNFKTTVFEAEALLGGLASWFEIGNQFLEKYYHFLCIHDHEYLKICAELELAHDLHWKNVRMGYFYNGKRYNFGAPWDLFLFPHLTFSEKIKFARAIQAIKSVPFKSWKLVADQRVVPWLKETFGEKVFEIIHAPLVSGKFGEYKENLSAAWMWARIHRVGKSRSKFLNLEIYGYLTGGSFRLMQQMAERIRNRGGDIFLNMPVDKILLEDGKVSGVDAGGQHRHFDGVISTIPFQFLRKIIPTQVDPYFRQLDSAEYYGVTCLVLRLKRPLTGHFWLNINDPRIEIPGVIEYTNLNPLGYLNGDSLLYIPQYLDPKDERFGLDQKRLLDKYIPYLKMINPNFSEDHIVEAFAFKNTHAQPLCDMGFHERIPNKKTPLPGLYVTDSYQLHPDDRTVSSSLQMGREAADLLIKDMI